MELNSFVEEKYTNITLSCSNKQFSFKEDNNRQMFGNLASMFTELCL